MSFRSSFDENILTSTADQLTAACRASFCIAVPMVQRPEECVAIVASGCFRPSFIEVPGGTNLDAFEYLAVRMEFWDGAPLGLHHVLTVSYTHLICGLAIQPKSFK